MQAIIFFSSFLARTMALMLCFICVYVIITVSMRKLLLVCAIVFSVIFLCHYLVVGQAVYGDGIYYFAYDRAVTLDHNLNFSTNAHHYDRYFNNLKQADTYEKSSEDKTKTG